jgi:hypothetical protein
MIDLLWKLIDETLDGSYKILKANTEVNEDLTMFCFQELAAILMRLGMRKTKRYIKVFI